MAKKLPRTTAEQFAGIVERTGLSIAPEQVEEYHLAHDRLMVLLARLRKPNRPREVEPLAVFRPSPRASK